QRAWPCRRSYRVSISTVNTIAVDAGPDVCYFYNTMLHNQQACILAAIIAAGIASAQPAFEVASVKPAKSETGRFTMDGGPGTNDPGRISYTNIMLRRVLLAAYDFRNYQISGPDWLNTLRFD